MWLAGETKCDDDAWDGKGGRLRIYRSIAIVAQSDRINRIVATRIFNGCNSFLLYTLECCRWKYFVVMVVAFQGWFVAVVLELQELKGSRLA
jgi:hypothetical protein